MRYLTASKPSLVLADKLEDGKVSRIDIASANQKIVQSGLDDDLRLQRRRARSLVLECP